MPSNRVYIYSGKVSDTRRSSYITADITVEIDVGEIIRWWGMKAATNKSGRSKALSGAIKLKATNVAKHKDEPLTLGMLGPLP
jgi:hypothetical protein